jgi:hypothetical protein
MRELGVSHSLGQGWPPTLYLLCYAPRECKLRRRLSNKLPAEEINRKTKAVCHLIIYFCFTVKRYAILRIQTTLYLDEKMLLESRI